MRSSRRKRDPDVVLGKASRKAGVRGVKARNLEGKAARIRNRHAILVVEVRVGRRRLGACAGVGEEGLGGGHGGGEVHGGDSRVAGVFDNEDVRVVCGGYAVAVLTLVDVDKLRRSKAAVVAG